MINNNQPFNSSKREINAIKISTIGVSTTIVKVILGFVYRTIFIYYLSKEYLGLNGLFTSVLQALSLAELGISSAITYRFYKPVSEGNVLQVGKLMNYFRKVYFLIALVITILGLTLTPFVPYMINNVNEIPKDINIYAIYLLFLVNSSSSYLFSYKLALLNVDQRNYVTSIIKLICNVVQTVSQIVVLIYTRNYTLTLCVGIICTILTNFIAGEWTKNKYKSIFRIKDTLSKAERKEIISDTKACMYHRFGTIALEATDNIVLTKMVSLAATAIYSNYSLIISNIIVLIREALGNFTSVIGNASNKVDKTEFYILYKRMLFISLWVSFVIATCVFIVVDDFIEIWIGSDYKFDLLTTATLSIQFFLMIARIPNASFTDATGLFIKDRIRPLIEALINIVISVVLTKYIGIAGVFMGTILSYAFTAFWRQPYILYKYSFKRKQTDFWFVFLKFFLSFVLFSLICITFKNEVLNFECQTFLSLLIETFVVLTFSLSVSIVISFRDLEFVFWLKKIKLLFSKLSRNN